MDGLGLSLARGETLGLVGESGCGKSTLSRALMRLVPAEAGRIELEGRDLLALPPRELLPWRKRVQLVFRDPYGSLNPRHRVEDILGHALAIHGLRAPRRTRGPHRRHTRRRRPAARGAAPLSA